MSDKATGADEQPEPRDSDPWAPPPRIPLDKPDAQPAPGRHAGVAPGPHAAGPLPPHAAPVPHAVVPPHAARVGPYGAPVPPSAPDPGTVPPVPLAPTGPGTPSAYQGNPYDQTLYGPPGLPSAASGPAPYGMQRHSYGQGPYGPGVYQPGSYGYPVAPFYVPPAPSNGMGLAALVLGIVGTVLAPTVVLGAVLGVLAIVFGAVGRVKARKGEATNPGQALAGLILGGVGLIATVLMVIVYINMDVDDSNGPAPEDDPEGTYGAYLSAPVLIVDRSASR